MSEFEDGGIQSIMSGPEVKPAMSYHNDRPSSRTSEERQAHYDAWREKYGAPYVAKVIENGGTPWFSSDEERERFWMRRYRRPAPPQGLLTSLELIRGEHKRWTPIQRETAA